MPLTASASRITRLMSWTSGVSTSPGCLAARKLAARIAASAAAVARLRPVPAAPSRAEEVEIAPHVVVEHGDVAARHVGDDDLVLVLDELAQDAAHRDHVVVRVRREADDPLAARAAWRGRGSWRPAR